MEPVKLRQLVQGIPGIKIKGSREIEITGLTADSNTVAPGNLFIARKGEKSDGSDFIPQAVQAGAAAVVTTLYDPFLKQTQILSDHPHALEAQLAVRYYRNPSNELWIAGITGTKGKTTTAYLLHHLLNGLKRPAGLIGTVETIVGEKRFPSAYTTHFAIHNQKLLREMVSAGSEAAVLEVSSHGLDQGRVDGIEFDLALFTNLFPDHLDYHKTLEAYAAAKKKLFERAETRIFNADSPWSEYMRGEGSGMTFGIEKPADLFAKDIRYGEEGTSFLATYRGNAHSFCSPLIGRFNVSNLLGAIAVGLHLGADLPKIASIFASIPPIPGRLERVENGRGIFAFVDFAHNGESLDNVLSSLRETARKRLIVLFGCGGGRDPARRKGMAAAAEKWADLSIVTSDNPREEDPEEICRQILAAFKDLKKTRVEIDRRKAIFLCMEIAESGDTVLIAGKGHERTQIFASQTVPFDDLLVAKEALS